MYLITTCCIYKGDHLENFNTVCTHINVYFILHIINVYLTQTFTQTEDVYVRTVYHIGKLKTTESGNQRHSPSYFKEAQMFCRFTDVRHYAYAN